MLAQPAASVSDLLLGLVTLALVPVVRRADVNRYWRATVWSAGVAALAGAVHHGFVVRADRWAGLSWALISVVIVVTISFTLAATAADVLEPAQARLLSVLRVASLGVYVVLAAVGHYGITTILACEAVTMVTILVLWSVALGRGDPRAAGMVLALAVSAAAGATRALPAGVTGVIGLDPVSVYHLAQIPAMVMLCLALRARRSTPARSPRRAPLGAVG